MIKQVSLSDILEFNNLGLLVNENFETLFKLNELLDKDYVYIFGYYIDNKLVAFLHIEKSFEVIDIINIVVNENYRNLKIAQKLLDYCFNYFNDVLKYMLEVKVTNIPAINLYKKNNFEIINTRVNYYNGVDGYVMKRDV